MLTAAALMLLAPCAVALGAEPMLTKTNLFEARTKGYYSYRIPGIVVTTKGTILAYCEARQDSRSDWANIDILLRRSLDAGKTWGPRQKLADIGKSTVNNPVAIIDRKTGTVHFLYCVNYARCFYMRSDDDGKSFSSPVEITETFEKFRPDYDWNVIATGPGHGIQLRSHRLLIPVWLSTGGKRHRPSVVSTIYSDDQGKTWKRGDIILRDGPEFKNPSETLPLQLHDGRVMLNIRNESKQARRLVSISADGATNWSKPLFDEELFEPICMASIIRLSEKPKYQKNRILFANPESGSRARKNVTIKLSYDEANSWPLKKVLEPGISGYSDLTVGPNGTIYCFYERHSVKKNHYDPKHLCVAGFNLEWLTDGKDALKPSNK
jgi:sialidase-1